MSLSPGTKLGPYEILCAAGAGGMGEVYKARDTRLDRDVAIKVLPAHLSQQPELKQRFEREARAISGLKHPHICTLHDIGQEGEMGYLVLEFLEGETLSKRLQRGALPIDELLKTAMQIADGLDRAHRSGIVHRDLKPGNVMLERSGAKLLDFGLAKARAAQAGGASDAPPSFAAAVTVDQSGTPLTTAGSVVGTIQYMSPEQVQGREADVRSDIFSFGAMLYEMATGKRAFQGESQLSVASAILEKVPEPVTALRPLNPPELEQLINACLEKDPDERVQSAHDIKLQLRWIAEGAGKGRALPLSLYWNRRRLAWLALPLLAMAALAAVGVSSLIRRPDPPQSVRATIPVPENKVMDELHLSTDGKWIALALATRTTGEQQIWVRGLDQEAPKNLETAKGGFNPFWAPAGDTIGFFSDHGLKRADISGSPALTICEVKGTGRASWGSKDEIIYSASRTGKLHRVAAMGGTPEPIPMEDGWHADFPFFLEDGEHFLYQGYARSKLGAEQGIYVTSLAGGRGKLLVKSANSPRYAAGHLFFVRAGVLMMQRFDADSHVVTGQPAPVAERLAENRWGAASYSVSPAALAFIGQSSASGSELVWYDRDGRPGDRIGGIEVFYYPAFSRDGKRLAVDVGRTPDVWVYDLDRPTRTRLTFGPEGDFAPIWSPDSSRLVYTTGASQGNEFQMFLKNASGLGEPELLTRSSSEIITYAWSPDGKYVLYTLSESGSEDIWMMPMEGKREPVPFLSGPYLEREPNFSFDGRWVAYLSTESGEEEVYVTDFPGRKGKWQISVGNGDRPRWNRNGREIFYLSNTDVVMSVQVEAVGDALRIGNPRPLFQTRPRRPGGIFQPSADGNRFLVVERGESAPPPASLLLNWKPLPKR